MVADLTIWRTGAQTFDVMSGRREDVEALLDCAGPGGRRHGHDGGRAIFAAQGPGTLDALRNLGDVDAIRRLEYFTFGHADLADIPCTVGDSAIPARPALRSSWRAARRAISGGRCPTIWPAGFVAADMLRIEAGFVLFANELALPVAPAEAGLARFHHAGHRRDPR